MKLLTKFANITEITISFRFINIKDSASVNGEIVTKATIINTFKGARVKGARVAQWVRSLDLRVHTSLSPIRRGFAPGFVNYKKGALDSQPQVIKFTSCLPMVGGSLRVLRLPPPLNLVAMIYLKYCWKWR